MLYEVITAIANNVTIDFGFILFLLNQSGEFIGL